MDRSPPPFFNQGLSANARLAFFSILAIVLLVVDSRMSSLATLRQGVGTALYPLQRTLLIPPERGRIFDAEGRILADNQRILTVTIDWKVIRKKTQRAELFARLSGVLKIPIEEMENRYAGPVGDDGERTGTIYDPLLPLPLNTPPSNAL